MAPLHEDKRCYATAAQREVLRALLAHPDIESSFFLTGGTALSVFYLHHRISDDLDLFTRTAANLGEIGFWIKRQWPTESRTTKEGPQFLSVLIRETRVDFVIDPVSLSADRERFEFEDKRRLTVDTIDNIVSNKLCTLVSRTEPKDFIDFYMIAKNSPQFCLEAVYAQSRKKDAVFDDPATAAFQLETGVAFFRDHPTLMPRVLTDYDPEEFFAFYNEIVTRLYKMLNPGRTEPRNTP